MPLTNLAVKNAQPKEKPYKLADEKGMYLLVNKTNKYFRLDFRLNGKRKTLALGVYPETSLKAARSKRDTARLDIARGLDPCEQRKIKKRQGIDKANNTFEPIAREFIESQSKTKWSPGHTGKVLGRLCKDVFPFIGNRPLADITAHEILDMLDMIQERGAIDTAHRVKQTCSQVFRYAITRKRIKIQNPTNDLKDALPSIRKKHFPTFTNPKQIAELLRAIDGYSGSPMTQFALLLAPLTFVRPGELRNAEWSEISIDNCEWRIPATKMKMKQEHIVPLSVQAINVIQQLQLYTGSGKYLFPSIRTDSRPMSANTVNAALRRLGYTKEEFTGHGFRAMASTCLHAQGWRSDIIERQLSHGEINPVKAAYCHAEYLPERKEMMQVWADYLDKLKAGAEIIPLKCGVVS